MNTNKEESKYFITIWSKQLSSNNTHSFHVHHWPLRSEFVGEILECTQRTLLLGEYDFYNFS